MVFIVEMRHGQNGENIFLKFIELRYKAIALSIRHLHFALNDVFEFLEHKLAARVTDIFFVGHKSVQASVPIVDIFPCGSFDQHKYL